ncbi:hypothetical protein OPV22_033479 [Ensete ventricosum]|uniref:Uncharacterized protein n=1 Tax=Ensete ventricosum TaxID=4639 RepID=A0AAV8PUD7_ENSVE|nr:hypothetical protein OPV22_033479 [Ensete ventricosum]
MAENLQWETETATPRRPLWIEDRSLRRDEVGLRRGCTVSDEFPGGRLAGKKSDPVLASNSALRVLQQLRVLRLVFLDKRKILNFRGLLWRFDDEILEDVMI